ncbi:aminoglycoside phosphotransferase family protein [Nocardioides sp. SYSU D00038]|uniref:aminoglycoside phosphotransferase family protein n=1 Tax=Nocardioides sp. SYSU D00038 TaxID=2812554 RepID=UPI0019681934|nr:aminoglycoside phosphotransferase family protein [Nocardioides sp. SYSU D00038]
MRRSELPAGVLAFADRGPDWAAYVEALPATVTALLAEWGLQPDGSPTHGWTALVLPVRAEAGPAVLKVGFVEEETEHEPLALQTWGGRGAVRMLRADPRRGAMLLERLGSRDLTTVDALAACEVVAGLYGRLHVPAPPQLHPLAGLVGRWTGGLARLGRGAPVPHRLVEQAVSLGRDLVADLEADPPGVLVHADLHYENVLAGTREPWLAVDPHPVMGDPHYEPAPMLWDRWAEVVASGDVRAAVRRRFHTLVDAGDLDEDRARDWVVVRMLHNVLWELEDHPGRPDHDWLTTCIAVAKAVQD